MWPFSTLKSLQLELAQAEHANITQREKIVASNAEWRKAYGDLSQAVRKEKDALIAEVTVKDGDIRQLNAQIAGLQSLNKSLAAERDEAVLRARNLLDRCDARSAELNEAKRFLTGAMVRDPKTGRLTKWVDRASVTPPLVSKTPEMHA